MTPAMAMIKDAFRAGAPMPCAHDPIPHASSPLRLWSSCPAQAADHDDALRLPDPRIVHGRTLENQGQPLN